MLEIFLIIQLLVCIVVFYQLLKKQNTQVSTILELEKEKASLRSENDFLKQTNIQIKQQSEKFETDLKYYFENYSNQLLKNKTETLKQETKSSLDTLLSPLKDKLNEFQHKVEQTYQAESREMFSLKNEVNKLLANNASMLKETTNLTNALKGNVKAQGVWGEIILEKILESSGLRAGIEYVTQGSELKLKDEDNKTLKPDVIVNLPDNKHLIIDAKVSLTHYEQYLSTRDDDYLGLFIKSIQSHINNLSSKNYQYNEKLLSPDFVMLFFPIEGAFSLALQTMPDLLMQAWHRKIIIVSPTTLFATLKTIASIWMFEKQNKNAMLIAKESGLLYDKLVSFTEDLTKVGQALSKAEEFYHGAVAKLSSGRGNIISKSEKIKKLGAKTKKQLTNEWNRDDNDDMDSDSSSDAVSIDNDKRELFSD